MNEHTPPDDSPKPPITGRQAYNLVSDTVTGPNIRLRDNLYQGLAIVVCLLLGIGIGFFTMTDRGVGAILGGIVGLLTGLFGSGIALMIYRAVKHVRGQHD